MALGWLSIFRLGLVQMALGAVVVLTTSTLNRVMVVELALPAILPGLLVAQSEVEHRTLAHGSLGPDPAAVSGHDTLDRREPEPFAGELVTTVQSLEGVEELA